MELAWLIVFSEVTRAALLFGSVALVARGNPRNGFGRALIATAILLVQHWVCRLVLWNAGLLIGSWVVALLAVLLVGYRLRPSRAIAAAAIVFAGWLGSIALFDLVRSDEVAEYAYLAGVPLAILVAWWVSVARSRRTPTPAST
jgi:hypothetical protein